MKLTDPWFEARLEFVGEGRALHVESLDGANAVFFYCPCSFGGDAGAHGCLIPFANPRNGVPHAPGPQGWQMSGSSLKDLSLTPSLLIGGQAAQCWHGYLTNGEFRSC